MQANNEVAKAPPPMTSPFLKRLGIILDERHPGHARLHMKIEDSHLQGGGIVHGGLLATMADCSLSNALRDMLKPEEDSSTIELKVNYLSPGRLGETLVVEGNIVQRGGRIAVGETEVREESTKRLVLKGIGTFIVQQRRPPPGPVS